MAIETKIYYVQSKVLLSQPNIKRSQVKALRTHHRTFGSLYLIVKNKIIIKEMKKCKQERFQN